MLGTDKEPGIYVRTLNDLFRAIEETSDDMLYSVSMSYLEVSPSTSAGGASASALTSCVGWKLKPTFLALSQKHICLLLVFVWKIP